MLPNIPFSCELKEILTIWCEKIILKIIKSLPPFLNIQHFSISIIAWTKNIYILWY